MLALVADGLTAGLLWLAVAVVPVLASLLAIPTTWATASRTDHAAVAGTTVPSRRLSSGRSVAMSRRRKR
jgi:hypothetical protein